jgi:phosphotransferase system enzyme I (PtsP)
MHSPADTTADALAQTAGGAAIPASLHLMDLARVVHEVVSAPNLEQALTRVVRHVRESMAVDICEAYLSERQTGDQVLLAGSGLSPHLVGQVRFRPGEGLIGRVAERAGPIALADATTHPDYIFHRKTGEADCPGFLGAPLTHQGQVLGVLIVRRRAHRGFSDTDEAFLVTLAAQLAGAVAYARATAVPPDAGMGKGRGGPCLSGQAGAPGVGVGTAVVLFHPMALDEVPDRAAANIETEALAFRAAIARTLEELTVLRSSPVSSASALCAALFDAYALMLQSDELLLGTLERIDAGHWAPGALRQIVEEHCGHFAAMDDPYLRERGSDLRSLGQRILVRLVGGHRPAVYPTETLLVGEQIDAMDLAEVPEGSLAGIVCAQGSTLSHVAILAHARGIPAVMGVGDYPLHQLDGRTLMLDGYLGRVYVDPDAEALRELERIQRAERAMAAELSHWRRGPASTADGRPVALMVNLAAPAEVALGAGADGVGLYRTEHPFMLHERFPSDDEQYQIYRHVLAAFAPRAVTIRTLDAGGDKALPYLPVREDNPFLGWRGIRMTLDRPEVFMAQIRAILRANAGLGNARVLLPMISGLEELERALALFERTLDHFVQDEGPTRRPPIGAMIEVPSAVYQAEAVARRVDFLSVGTNDLTQYLLAVDRTNPRVAALLEPLHPAVLRALRDIVDAARAAGKPVGCCGELAGEPGPALLLLGLGFDELSMGVTALPHIRRVVHRFTLEQMQRLAQRALLCDRAQAVRDILEGALTEAGLGALGAHAL